MDKFNAVYVIQSNGNLSRVRTGYNQQQSVVDALEVALSDHARIEITCKHPDYETLRKRYLLIGDTGLLAVRKILHKFLAALPDSRVEGQVWVVCGHEHCDRHVLGCFTSHKEAMEIATLWEDDHNTDRDDDIYATLELVEFHG